MFIGDYIDSKPNKGIRTLNKIEAKLFGESWPLTKGWFERLQNKTLDCETLAELTKRLADSEKLNPRKKSIQKAKFALTLCADRETIERGMIEHLKSI